MNETRDGRRTSDFDVVWWVLRRRAGLVATTLGLMIVTPYLGSLPVRSIPSVVAIASGEGGASGEIAWLLGADPTLGAALALLIAAGALAFALALATIRIAARLSALATRDLRLRLHAALLIRNPSWLRQAEDGPSNADLMRTALVGQSQIVGMFATNTVPAVFGVFAATIIWGQTLMSAISSPGNEATAILVVLLVVFVLVAVNLTAVWLAGRKTQVAQTTVMMAQASLMGAVSESVSSLSEVQLNTAESAQHTRLATILDGMAIAQVRVATWSGLAAASSRGVVLLGIPLLVFAWQSLGLVPASLAVMIPALLMLQRSVSSAGSLVTSMKVSRPAIKLVSELSSDVGRELDATPSLIASQRKASSTPATIRFSKVCYTAGDNEILRGLDLEVAAGETVAIVGAGGSGKSTLLRLALRLEEPAPGTVFVGDNDVCEMSTAELRTTVGILRQHPSFFSRSLKSNLVLDDHSTKKQELDEALEAAEASELAERIGYEGAIDATSVTLSGSERRRLALARVLLRQPSVLLIDELEAGLPQSLAITLWQQIREFSTGERTCLLVTHRPDLLEVDRVAFLKDGKIFATASHEELERDCQPYRELLAEKRSEADVSENLSATPSENDE